MPFYRGAPFDKGNIFFIPAIDGGLINPPANYVSFQNIEGGSANQTPQAYLDGGTIPKAGTASYDPNVEYGPDSPLIEFDNE